MKYKEDGVEGWYTIGVNLKFEEMWTYEDEREENRYSEYDEKYSIGNVITRMMMDDWIEPTLEEYENYLID